MLYFSIQKCCQIELEALGHLLRIPELSVVYSEQQLVLRGLQMSRNPRQMTNDHVQIKSMLHELKTFP